MFASAAPDVEQNEPYSIDDVNFCDSHNLVQNLKLVPKFADDYRSKWLENLELQANSYDITHSQGVQIIKAQGNPILSTSLLKLLTSEVELRSTGGIDASDVELNLFNGAYRIRADQIERVNEQFVFKDASIDFCEDYSLFTWGLVAKHVSIDEKEVLIKSSKIKLFGLSLPGPPSIRLIRQGTYANGLLFPNFQTIDSDFYFTLPVYFRLRRNIDWSFSPWISPDNGSANGFMNHINWLTKYAQGEIANYVGTQQQGESVRLDLLRFHGNLSPKLYIDLLYKNTNSLDFFNQFRSLLLTGDLSNYWINRQNNFYAEFSDYTANYWYELSLEHRTPFFDLRGFNPKDTSDALEFESFWQTKSVHSQFFISNQFSLRSNNLDRLSPFEIIGNDKRNSYDIHAGWVKRSQPWEISTKIGLSQVSWQPDAALKQQFNATEDSSMDTSYFVVEGKYRFGFKRLMLELKAQSRTVQINMEQTPFFITIGQENQTSAVAYPFLNALATNISPHSLFRTQDLSGKDNIQLGGRSSVGIQGIYTSKSNGVLQFNAVQARMNYSENESISHFRNALGLFDTDQLSVFNLDYQRKYLSLSYSATEDWFGKSEKTLLQLSNKYVNMRYTKVRADKTAQLGLPADYSSYSFFINPISTVEISFDLDYSERLKSNIKSEIRLLYQSCCVELTIGYKESYYQNTQAWDDYLLDPINSSELSTLLVNDGFYTKFRLKMPLVEYF